MKVLIAVTHLLGTGHLARALNLGRAFVGEGHDVTIASGGMPASLLDHGGVSFVQLPPIRSDGTNFTRLLDDKGQPATTPTFDARRAALIATLTPAPDIVITELFPFGRRVLSEEFISLLERAKSLPRPPVILASIRDILAPPSKPSKAARADDIIAQFYTGVLVHSDPVVTELNQSWPVSDMLRARLKYTGYVAPPATGPHPENLGQDEVLISAGGGNVGDALFETALRAAQLMLDKRWRLLVAGHNVNARINALAQLNPSPRTIIEPARPDFRQMLHHAAASVSMCGYNTALDLMQAGTPAVLVPFDDGQEVEQALRAQSLGHLPAIDVLKSTEMNPETLCAAVERVINDGRRDNAGLRFDGAQQSVSLAVEMAKARP